MFIRCDRKWSVIKIQDLALRSSKSGGVFHFPLFMSVMSQCHGHRDTIWPIFYHFCRFQIAKSRKLRATAKCQLAQKIWVCYLGDGLVKSPILRHDFKQFRSFHKWGWFFSLKNPSRNWHLLFFYKKASPIWYYSSLNWDLNFFLKKKASLIWHYRPLFGIPSPIRCVPYWAPPLYMKNVTFDWDIGKS